ncbi:hypothetical protein Tco_0630068 [Tanacetum coccineum]
MELENERNVDDFELHPSWQQPAPPQPTPHPNPFFNPNNLARNQSTSYSFDAWQVHGDEDIERERMRKSSD